MRHYYIRCLQRAPLSSWHKLYTRDEIIEKFMDYASMDYEEMPPKKWFTLKNIAEVWQVEFIPVTECIIKQTSEEGEDDGLTWYTCLTHNKDTLSNIICEKG